MKTKQLSSIICLLLMCGAVKAQVNLQEVYDFNRNQMKTTLEVFPEDSWGKTYSFVDIYQTVDFVAPSVIYTEIGRSINFWNDTVLKDFSLHIEYNGGCGISYENGLGFTGLPINNAWLFGAEYSIHSKNDTNYLTLRVSYKIISGTHSEIPMQLTAVWSANDLFGVKNLVLFGFADFWWEDNTWDSIERSNTKCVFLAGPQLWYNIGRLFNCKNLFVGGSVEVSCNFTGNGPCPAKPGWRVNPASGLKWNF